MTTMMGFDKKTLSFDIAAVVATILALTLTPTGAAAGACAKMFKKCGCTISAPGSYTLINYKPGVPFPPPVKSTGTCIDIAASNVVLDGIAFVELHGSAWPVDISGPGPNTPTVGIDIEPSAKNVIVYGGLTPDGFGQGIRIDGANATVSSMSTSNNNKGIVVNGANATVYSMSTGSDNKGIVVNGANATLYSDFVSDNQMGIVVNGTNAHLVETSSFDNEAIGIQINKTATNFLMVGGNTSGSGTPTGTQEVGIELDQVSGAVLTSTEAFYNGTFGIWLNGASDNVITNFDSESNGIAGVYLGCNAAGPNGSASCPSGASSHDNVVIGVAFNPPYSSVINNSNFSQSYGIAVEPDSVNNDFLTIYGDGNLVDDALDENPNCGTNRWFGNTFTTSSPAQNTTDYCIN